jgi:hypothetical protein
MVIVRDQIHQRRDHVRRHVGAATGPGPTKFARSPNRERVVASNSTGRVVVGKRWRTLVVFDSMCAGSARCRSRRVDVR